MTDDIHNHDHKHNHNHNHDHAHHGHEEEEFETIVLTDEEGEDHEFLHLDTLEVDGGTYFVLMPMGGDDEAEESDEDADEAIILKLGHDDDGNEMLLDIENDEEWEKVADAWESLEEEE